MPMNEPPKGEGQEHFERHLRGFRPIAPRALAIPVRRVPRGVIAVAAGVLLVVAGSVAVKRSRHPIDTVPVAHTNLVRRPYVASRVTLGKLNAALRTSDRDLNQMLDDASPRLLPREHRGTALFELCKEKE